MLFLMPFFVESTLSEMNLSTFYYFFCIFAVSLQMI